MAKKIKENEIITEVKKEIVNPTNIDLIILEADNVVAKHKMILKLVAECLQKHKKEHDELLAIKLYNYFEKNLEG